MAVPRMRAGTRRLLGGIWGSAFRVKSPRYHVTGEETGGATYETLWELVSAALPGCVGVGCLVVAGQVATHLGPGGVISALVAAVSVSLTGICYAELRSRWPRTLGSPYEYAYLSVGEGIAFVIFVMTSLQDVAMVAATGRVFSQSLDFLLGNVILNQTRTTLGCWESISSCPDPIGGATVLVVSALVTCGVREKQRALVLLTNYAVLLVLVFTLVVGLFHLDFRHWRNPTDFFPASYPGIIEGAATIIYAFSTFELICSRSDFSRQKSGRTAVAAFTLSGVLSGGLFAATVAMTTLLTPFGVHLTETPLPEAFSYAGVRWMKYIICIPTMLAMLVYMWMTLTRIHDLLKAVSLDALLCPKFSDVSSRTGMALLSVVISAIPSALMSSLFGLMNLIQLASLSCLVVSITACTAAVCIRFRPSILVHSPEHTTAKDREERRKHRKRKQGVDVELEAASVTISGGGYGSVTMNNNTDDCAMLILNSEEDEENILDTTTQDDLLKDHHNNREHSKLQRKRIGSSDSDTDIDDAVEEYKEELRIAAFTSCSFITPKSETPTNLSARRAAWTIMLFVASLFGLFLLLTHGVDKVRSGNAFLILLLVIFLLLIIALLVILLHHPQDPISDLDLELSFPLSPWIPLLAIILNVHLALNLPAVAWIQALVVFVVGCLLYATYGIHNSRASHFYQFLPEEETMLLPEPPRHLADPQVPGPRPTTSSEEDVSLVD